MKNRRFFGLAALLGVMLAVSQPFLKAQVIVLPTPDLRVLSATEIGNTATITIRNSGAANATGTFMVRAFEWKNGAWYGCGYKWVNGLAVGTNAVVQIPAVGISNSNNKYVVDSNDTVNESNETNNVYYVFGP